jgi:hypothetical protein
MDWVFTCPDCEHQTAYQPEECDRFVRFKREGTVEERFYLLVRCVGCRKAYEVPEAK